MPIRTRSPRFLNRLCQSGLVPFVLAALTALCLPATRAAEPNDDLNLLLRLLSQDVCLGRVVIARPIDPLWIKDIRSLQSSPNAAVAETARAVETTAVMRREALRILETAEAKNKQLRDENSVDIVDAVRGLLPEEVSDEELDEAVRSSRITRSEAAAYRARRSAKDTALMTLGKVALLSYAHSYLADEAVRKTRRKAEMLEADALAEHLLPALRGRAGAKRDDPPVRIVTGFTGDKRQELRLLTTVFSTSDEPLTQLTLLMEIESHTRRRRAVAYIPRLEPGRGAQVFPVAYDFFVATHPAENEEVSVIRHSVWCDQFTFEGPKIPLTAGKHAATAYCALVGDQGLGYAFDHLGVGRDRDSTGYTLEFTELTGGNDTFHTKGKLLFYETDSREKPTKVTPFTGTFRGIDPPLSMRTGKAAKGRAPPPLTETRIVSPDAHLTITSGKLKSDIDLFITEDGRVEWMPRTGPLQNRVVRTPEESREAARLRAEIIRTNTLLGKARLLATEGKKEEAAKMLNDFIATNPGEDSVKRARTALDEVDALAAKGAETKAGRDARGKSSKRPGVSNPKSSAGGKPGPSD